MNYWKHIDVPEFEALTADLAKWFQENPHGENGERWNEVNMLKIMLGVPRLSKALRHLGVRATYIVAIILRQYDRPIIHIDNMPGVQARLLLPVLNTEGSFTAFYETEAEGRFATDYDQGKKSYQFEEKDVTEVTRFALTAPTVMRVDKPHAVICNSNQFPRITLSIRFNRDPVWMLE